MLIIKEVHPFTVSMKLPINKFGNLVKTLGPVHVYMYHKVFFNLWGDVV